MIWDIRSLAEREKEREEERERERAQEGEIEWQRELLLPMQQQNIQSTLFIPYVSCYVITYYDE